MTVMASVTLEYPSGSLASPSQADGSPGVSRTLATGLADHIWTMEEWLTVCGNRRQKKRTGDDR
jgi:hypothetical protein